MRLAGGSVAEAAAVPRPRSACPAAATGTYDAPARRPGRSRSTAAARETNSSAYLAVGAACWRSWVPWSCSWPARRRKPPRAERGMGAYDRRATSRSARSRTGRRPAPEGLRSWSGSDRPTPRQRSNARASRPTTRPGAPRPAPGRPARSPAARPARRRAGYHRKAADRARNQSCHTPSVGSGHGARSRTVFCCHRVRHRIPEVGRSVPRLRRVEHAWSRKSSRRRPLVDRRCSRRGRAPGADRRDRRWTTGRRSRPASPSSIGCSAAVWFPGRSPCSAASPASASPPLLLQLAARVGGRAPGAVRLGRGVPPAGPAAGRALGRRSGRGSGCRPRACCRTSSASLDEIEPDLLVVDSIQAVHDPELGSAPGSVGQVRERAPIGSCRWPRAEGWPRSSSAT